VILRLTGFWQAGQGCAAAVFGINKLKHVHQPVGGQTLAAVSATKMGVLGAI
jgi:hypothetical protein